VTRSTANTSHEPKPTAISTYLVFDEVMNSGTTAATQIGRFQIDCQRSRAFSCSGVSGPAGAVIAVRFAVHVIFRAASIGCALWR